MFLRVYAVVKTVHSIIFIWRKLNLASTLGKVYTDVQKLWKHIVLAKIHLSISKQVLYAF